MKRRRVIILAGALVLAMALGVGCKPFAQRDVDRLAEQVRNEPGSVDKLRRWFDEVQATAQSQGERPFQLVLPQSLTSTWWLGSRGLASWSADGALLQISVVRTNPTEVYEPFLVVAPLSAIPETLGLKAEHPFFAEVAPGMYTYKLYK